MKFTSILYAGTLAVAAIAAPLADLEREQFGSVLPRTHLSPEIAKRVGGHSKPPRDKVKIERIRSSRHTGDPEIREDYAARRRDAPQYPRGEWTPWRDSTPEPGKDGTVLRKKQGGEPYFDHYYAEESQPWTADVWRTAKELYPQYDGYGFKMRHGDDQRLYTLATPKIDTPTWAKGTDREEEPPQSFYYPEGAFTVGRVPNEESKYQSYMLRAASAKHPDAEHYFHDNRRDKSNRVTIVRGPRAEYSNGAYDYDPQWGIPRIPDSDVENSLYPA